MIPPIAFQLPPDRHATRKMILRGTLAFTMVEMLVSIAIVIALVAIMLPVSSQLSAHSKKVKCAQQLRQIWTALSLYSNENRGRLPGPSYKGVSITAPSIPAKLLPYTGNTDRLWDCPARPNLRDLRGHTGYIQGSYYQTGVGTLFPFGYPAGSGNAEKKPMTLLEISQLPDPSLCWLLSDADSMNYSTPGLADYAPDPAHKQGRNVLHHDGRVLFEPVPR